MKNDEKVVETKQCKHCNISFEITNKDLDFYEKVSPIFDSIKYSIPSPSLCPECRQQRRLSFRNERNLYKRKCDSSGKDMISIYSPDKEYKVYNQEIWWSDSWDALGYGRVFDFERGFFEQFNELIKEVPKVSLISLENSNSNFANYVGYSKSIYMSYDVLDSEDLYYSYMIKGAKNGLDLYDVEKSNNCYECISSVNLFNCFYVYFSDNCVDSIGLYNCKNLTNCLFCTNLNNKKYFIFNKEYKKNEYEKICKDLNINKSLETFYENINKVLKKSLNNYNSENIIGNNLLNSNNCYYCYDSKNIEDCRYCIVAYEMKDCMDTTIHNPDCFLDYEAINGGKISNSISNITCREGSNLYYTNECFSSSNLFGCIGLKNKSYCILNKQYTKEEYNSLVPKIIEHMKKTGEWGEFFPSSISPFGYNETVAQEYFPLNPPLSSGHLPLAGEKTTNPPPAREGLRFNWSTYTPPLPKVSKIIPADKLPQNISDIPDDILNWAIECEVTNKPFKIIKPELEFYRKHNLPIPKRHPDQRHLDRMKLRNPRKLFDRDCDKCGEAMKTTYSPEREEIVYCEECYNKEVY